MKRVIIFIALLATSVQCISQSGRFNNNVNWRLQPDGTLEVEGECDIAGLRNARKAPFVKNKLADKIHAIDLSSYYGRVGSYIFCGLKNLKTIIVNNDKNGCVFDGARSFNPDVKIELLEFVSNEFSSGCYRVNYNYIPDSEALLRNLSDYRNNIQRVLAIRDRRIALDTVTVHGKYTGKGMKVWSNPENGIRIYYGDWLDGEMHGHGIAVMFDGTVKMGNWEENSYKGHPETITLQEFLDFPEVLPLNLIAQNHIGLVLNRWQQKGEYESIEDWSIRVNEATHKERVEIEYKLLVDQYTENIASKTNLNLQLGAFDSDNETYLVVDDVFGEMPIALTSHTTPQQFKTQWEDIVKVPTYYYDGEKLAIWDITFWINSNKVAYYHTNAQLEHHTIPIDYNFNPISLPWIEKNNRYVLIPSDVDIDIPMAQRENDSTFVFIVANENYNTVQSVPFALNDGNVFASYCEKTLGIPVSHIKKYKDASYGQLLECVATMKQITEAYDGRAKVLFYYAGHAFPDDEKNNAYLLPVDGNPKMAETSYGLHKLYAELGDLKARLVICFIDACFSGATRQDDMLLASRGVTIKPKDEIPKGNMIVFTSSSEYESSMMYQNKSHGMFTYYLLKKMKESKGETNLGDLADYLHREVRRNSVLVNQKIQTPRVLVSPNIDIQWRIIKL